MGSFGGKNINAAREQNQPILKNSSQFDYEQDIYQVEVQSIISPKKELLSY